jgi:hypothetical protein
MTSVDRSVVLAELWTCFHSCSHVISASRSSVASESLEFPEELIVLSGYVRENRGELLGKLSENTNERRGTFV